MAKPSDLACFSFFGGVGFRGSKMQRSTFRKFRGFGISGFEAYRLEGRKVSRFSVELRPVPALGAGCLVSAGIQRLGQNPRLTFSQLDETRGLGALPGLAWRTTR